MCSSLCWIIPSTEDGICMCNSIRLLTDSKKSFLKFHPFSPFFFLVLVKFAVITNAPKSQWLTQKTYLLFHSVGAAELDLLSFAWFLPKFLLMLTSRMKLQPFSGIGLFSWGRRNQMESYSMYHLGWLLLLSNVFLRLTISLCASTVHFWIWVSSIPFYKYVQICLSI